MSFSENNFSINNSASMLKISDNSAISSMIINHTCYEMIRQNASFEENFYWTAGREDFERNSLQGGEPTIGKYVIKTNAFCHLVTQAFVLKCQRAHEAENCLHCFFTWSKKSLLSLKAWIYLCETAHIFVLSFDFTSLYICYFTKSISYFFLVNQQVILLAKVE